jgi:outer membrane protein OmpA-like peptidoglycan-associated protein
MGRQDPQRKAVGLCFDKQKCSGWRQFPISDSDYAELIRYADFVAFERSTAVNSSRQNGNEKDLADARARLSQYVAELPDSERESTRRFIGSVLADAEPTEADLLPYVQEYRVYVKQNALTELAAKLRSSTLEAGEPIVTVGSASVTALDLKRVNPADVETFVVNATRFKGAWIGSSFVFVPQSTDKVTDRTGLGINEQWAQSSSRIVPRLQLNLDVPAPSNYSNYREEQIAANNRINGLDDFDPLKTITVSFATGSATLSPSAKATIDEAAAWVKTQNTKGWIMAVVGYADTTGSSQRNIDLSERRVNAVIYYLVTKYKVPLSRLVQPFGYGQLNPIAENTTAADRSKNRRVEIRLMVRKGISEP